MAYEDFCAACTYLGENDDYDGKYYLLRKYEDKNCVEILDETFNELIQQ